MSRVSRLHVEMWNIRQMTPSNSKLQPTRCNSSWFICF